MRLKLISCDIFEQELQAACARSSNRIEIDILTQPPHQLSEHEMLACLQSRIDRADRTGFHAVLVVAGSCKHGLTGLRARSIPLVLPRAKDCISLLLEAPRQRTATAGTKQRSRSVLDLSSHSSNPSAACEYPTYWMAPVETPVFHLTRKTSRLDYGKPQVKRQTAPTLLFPPRPDGPGRRRSVLEMLVEGYWNHADFLVVPAGWQVVVQQPQRIIAAQEFRS